ncbi:MAG: carboxypeptidase regulatory-like domain-containing protein [Deltaproteobacteria bacterium]|nr:carboxypeptidase regulatory-like domain-containing protein [Deltaproteobacteria bacterium]
MGKWTRAFHLILMAVFVMGSILAAPDVGICAPKKDKVQKSGAWGRVLLDKTGEPVQNAYIYAYSGVPRIRSAEMGIIGITDWVSHGSAADGSYRLDLPPGEYYLVARKRASGANYGPLSTGDLYDHSKANLSTRIRKGHYTECNFVLVKLTEPLFFQGLTQKERETTTGIKGRLLDENGEHVPGTFVMAYKNDDMYRLPDFASTLTDDNGDYTLYLPAGGRYWLAARFFAMKIPVKGEPFARYEGSDNHSVVVKDGTFIEGIDMTLRPYDGSPPKGYQPVQ